MRKLFLSLPILILIIIFSFRPSSLIKNNTTAKPKVCFSFDDGDTSGMPGYSSQQWNALLLGSLKKYNLQAILFVKGKALDNDRGKQILDHWNKDGHLIANHTYSHKSFNGKEITIGWYKNDLLKNDSLINGYTGYTKLFRFPFLKEGDTEEKRDQFRAFLKEQHYQNGYVTIDASDWYINGRLVKRLKQNPQADVEAYKTFYLEHIYDRATYYNDLALKLTGRQIDHTLLLHHNLSSALFIDDLIKLFKAKGWEVINAGKAYEDPIYQKTPTILPAGESLIWALAKESGQYNKLLRYPAEDGSYEEPKMNKLGL